jgi:hypothetical protein
LGIDEDEVTFKDLTDGTGYLANQRRPVAGAPPLPQQLLHNYHLLFEIISTNFSSLNRDVISRF